jgi:hypothetical protein
VILPLRCRPLPDPSRSAAARAKSGSPRPRKCGIGWPLSAQKRSIKRRSHARGVRRERLDLDADDLSLLGFLEHRVERVRLGPAVCRRVDSVRNGSQRFDGSFGHVRIDPKSDGCGYDNGPDAVHECLRGVLARCHPAPRQQQCPRSDGGARLSSTGSSDAPSANA